MDIDLERQIARGLSEGNVEAWQALYDAYARQTWRAVARRMGPRVADVADVVQETFLAAARSARHYDPEAGSLGAWLDGIARRHVALHFRKQERRERIGEAAKIGRPGRCEPGPGDGLESAETAAQVRAALAQLSHDHEALLVQKYLDGSTVDQIAARQACSAVAVRSKLARARQAFRLAFERMKTQEGDHAS